MKRWHIGLLAAVAVVAIAFFVAVWQFLAPTDRTVIVPYSGFLAEVHAGKVESIRIHDREYRYTTNARGPDDHVIVKTAIGPVADQALVDSLKPDDKDKVPPKIIFER